MRLATLVLTVAVPIVGFACDCARVPSMEFAMDASDLIVHALVIHADHQKALDQDRDYLDSLGRTEQRTRFGPVHVNEYVLVVMRSFKGALQGDTLTLRTGLDPVTDCGLLLSEGTEIVLYARTINFGEAFYDPWLGKNGLTTSSCSRTRSFSRKEVKRLAKKMDRSL